MAELPLILVTRSGPEGASLAGLLRAREARVLHFAPVVLAGPADPDDCRRRLLAALPADCLVVPSARALQEAVALVGVGKLAALPLIVPGAGTARAARSLGFEVVCYPSAGGTSEDILALPELNNVSGRKILILAAAGGRREIQRGLSARGASVERVHVYRRLPRAVPADLAADLDRAADPITLLASGGALDALRQALSPESWVRLGTGLVVAPSARVARLASAAGCAQVVDAGGADHASMLAALAAARPDLKLHDPH